ncbi:MAG TPA: threo-3-hydroxy-L-aspartate ammonia-lyase [Aggregatilineaceae bacterium]|nr:threo-3-hydroxy-L-aspartate ammonia-lyase [Aggregatilineaceae bacterium]
MFELVQAASDRLRPYIHRTPVLTARTLNQQVGADVFLKCENFQRIGAFKARGAFNAIIQLSDAEKARGVITYSSGNHAQAVALACRTLGIRAIVVMPTNAPAIKRAATEGYGAELVLYDPHTQDRRTIAESLAAEHGYTVVPPYDHIHIVAGQGTAALELLQDVAPLDALLVPCGGGGLLSGSAIAAKGFSPACRVIGIEPELADDATRSFRTGTLHTVHNPPTIADGTRTPSLGEVTFPLVRHYVDDMQTVTEAAIIDAVRFLFYRMKLVVEPSGALGVAALLSGAVQLSGRVGVILSGGNIDAETMIRILAD